MIHEKYFKDFFESITDYRNSDYRQSLNSLLIFSIKDDNNFLKEMGFSKNDKNEL